MALVITPTTKALLDAIGVDVDTAFSGGISDGTGVVYPQIPGYDKLTPANRTLGTQGVLSTLAPLVQALRKRDRVTPSLQNGFTGFGAGDTATYYVTADGMLHFEGTIRTPASPNGKVIFMLPTELRPSVNKVFSVASNGSAASLYITTTGAVWPLDAASNSWLSLSGVYYSLV